MSNSYEAENEDRVPDVVLGKTWRGSLERPIGLPKTSPNLTRVTMVCTEFTSRCPVTGQPDFGTVEISFIPDGQIIESKSLKLYLLKFREEGVFCEALACQIAEEIFESIQPMEIQVTVTQQPRGGISIIAESSLERVSALPTIPKRVAEYLVSAEEV